jgi:hypothetical protein
MGAGQFLIINRPVPPVRDFCRSLIKQTPEESKRSACEKSRTRDPGDFRRFDERETHSRSIYGGMVTTFSWSMVL